MTTAPAARRRWVRRPAVHFALLGALLLAVRMMTVPPRAAPPRPRPERAPIHITAERLRLMEAAFADRWGAPPTAEQRRALIDQVVEEELLYREAQILALGFDDASIRRRLLEKARAVGLRRTSGEAAVLREAVDLGLDDDEVIRRLLAAKMRLVLRAPDGDDAPTDAALADYLERHRERYLQPARVTISHVFFAAARGDRLAADAAAARVALGAAPPSDGARLSDPFALGNRLQGYTHQQLLGRFGRDFADQVVALPPGAWSQPLASPYGLHLVWVEARLPERLPALETVRPQLLLAVEQERAATRLSDAMARLRSLYEVRVDDPGGRGM